MADAGCEYAVMEVSSFALSQNRTGPAVFELALFTNLTQDHLDYHKTMDAYFEAKKKLFTTHCESALICVDDEYGRELFATVKSLEPPLKNLCSYGLSVPADFCAAHIKINGGTTFWLSIDKKTYPVSLRMVGDYNAANAAAAAAGCVLCGVTLSFAATALGSFGGVPGRCEVIYDCGGLTVMRDYAHTPDGFEKVLRGVRGYVAGRVICVFGCGGDRDREKRPLMGKAAEKYADLLIVTSDNPRSEEPEKIIDDIIAGLDGSKPRLRTADRREAIRRAVEESESGDMIILLGKGHETYQIIGDLKRPFDEKAVVKEIMSEIGAGAKGGGYAVLD
jgi:UDP-N-acetylmuramoyl-L-alanyl-D-glutamate--2,6-diaminopimelate ligase